MNTICAATTAPRMGLKLLYRQPQSGAPQDQPDTVNLGTSKANEPDNPPRRRLNSKGVALCARTALKGALVGGCPVLGTLSGFVVAMQQANSSLVSGKSEFFGEAASTLSVFTPMVANLAGSVGLVIGSPVWAGVGLGVSALASAGIYLAAAVKDSAHWPAEYFKQ